MVLVIMATKRVLLESFRRVMAERLINMSAVIRKEEYLQGVGGIFEGKTVGAEEQRKPKFFELEVPNWKNKDEEEVVVRNELDFAMAGAAD